MNFTNDEMNLMCIYNTGSRESLMRELREMRGYIGADQPELLAMTRNLQSWNCSRISTCFLVVQKNRLKRSISKGIIEYIFMFF